MLSDRSSVSRALFARSWRRARAKGEEVTDEVFSRLAELDSYRQPGPLRAGLGRPGWLELLLRWPSLSAGAQDEAGQNYIRFRQL